MSSATRGVSNRSIVGSSARFKNNTVCSSAPLASNWRIKNDASRCVMPIAPNTTTNFSPVPRTVAWVAICAATSFAGKPYPEKIGSFCPRTSVFNPSSAEKPV